ncbi:BspA family leucine-rich repeat surface protein [Enterococcus quebecensis]|uniref:BIG2 domain-containing protein n=1 Tax=Enterococcus quebecensis TaxID=903983 RepID=A0A1E5GQY0_9ENTE|nr:BspA family leucine-rich repeat surface protein [Enterococcus quebecensis]OEG14640.1 hypothetical protein BCR23_12455 [Enterococcus quebecensis]OJG73312.1 hypothetical protein RV12_GL000719 [Enterococcus quebecensis]
MKKNKMIKGLIMVGLIGMVGLQSPIALAEEQKNFINEMDANQSNKLEETIEEVTPKSITTNSENENKITGTFGTVPWTFEEETQTLIFDEGEFPNTDQLSNIEKNIRPDIKHITFAKPVIANKNSSYLFNSLKELESIKGLELLNTNNVTNMSYMFSHTTNLTTLNISNWNTGTLTDMTGMFLAASALTALDLTEWDTSNVRDMTGMFAETISLTTLDLNKWDTSNVISMAYMFHRATSLTSLDLNNWNVSNVISMGGLFADTSNLKELTIDNWDTSNATDMYGLFFCATSLTSLDLSKWNTDKVKNMHWIFYGASNLTSLDISSWNTHGHFSNSSYPDNMFSGTSSLDTLILGENSLLNNSEIPEKKDERYTGKWTLVSQNTQNGYSSSEDLMANYNGSIPGKYIREKYEDIIKVNGVELSSSILELTVSKQVTLQPKITPENASNKKVIYTSSDHTVATVSSEGVVTGLKKGTAVLTATTEDGGFQAISTVTVTEPTSLFIDPFYLGIDHYVTGSLDSSLSAKKVQLVVNGEVISTSTVFSDGSFELDTKGMITKVTDKVEVIALDRKNKELERTTVKLEEKSYALTLNPYILYEDSTVSGQTDYFHTHVALLINGEEIERKPLSSTRQFNFDVEGLIEYADDEVEVIGYRYDDKITRKEVAIQEPVIEIALSPYKVGDPYLAGKVIGKSAKNVRLYVNGRRQQTIKVAEDGTFSLLGMAILSPEDKVQVAVLNDSGIEIKRFAVTVTN